MPGRQRESAVPSEEERISNDNAQLRTKELQLAYKYSTQTILYKITT